MLIKGGTFFMINWFLCTMWPCMFWTIIFKYCKYCKVAQDTIDHHLVICKNTLEFWSQLRNWWKAATGTNVTVGNIWPYFWLVKWWKRQNYQSLQFPPPSTNFSFKFVSFTQKELFNFHSSFYASHLSI